MELHFRKQAFGRTPIPLRLKWTRRKTHQKVRLWFTGELHWEWSWKPKPPFARHVPHVTIYRRLRKVGAITYEPNDPLDRAPEAAKISRLSFSERYTLYLGGTVTVRLGERERSFLQIPFDPELGFIFPFGHGDSAVTELVRRVER